MNQHNTLTEVEITGLNSKFNFADGHAYHDLLPSQQLIINNLDQIWRASARLKVKEAEWLYKEAFCELAESPALKHYAHFNICPTASNSIDIVAAWLADQSMSVTLLEPTFDNLYLLLKRRNVKVMSLDEEELHQNTSTALAGITTDAIFLVNPNNPTGKTLSENQFVSIVNYCVTNNKTLLLDNTFRFFVEQYYDQFQILIDSGVSFITIEDTGKVWPTQDMKVSLIIYSDNVASQLKTIYEELYLCVSNFSLGILTKFLQDAKENSLAETVWREVESRRFIFRHAIESTALSIAPAALASKLSIEWVEINSLFKNDHHIMEFMKERELIILPGRNFYWNRHGDKSVTNKVRFSLLKPRKDFIAAINTLRSALDEADYALTPLAIKKRAC